jgi:L-iditol 2-dehydrogenase
MATIKSAFKKGKEVTLKDITLRELRADEIRIKVTACGICGTDLQVWPGAENNDSGFGHEIAGTILEIGAHVTGFSVGQKVVLDSSSSCGKCDNCKNEKQELCLNMQGFFSTGQFGFAEEMLVPAISAVLCEDLSPEVGCLSEPLGVAIDMVRLADIKLDSNVLILGPGPIGLMALAIVKKMGVRKVFLSSYDTKIARNEVARKFGVDEIVDPSKTPLSEYDFGCNIDRILVTTPPATLEEAFKVASKGAIISFIGIAHGEDAFCKFNVNDFHFKKLQLRASFASPALYTPLAAQYLREGIVDGEAIISHRFPLTDIVEAMKVARDTANAVKVVIMP